VAPESGNNRFCVPAVPLLRPDVRVDVKESRVAVSAACGRLAEIEVDEEGLTALQILLPCLDGTRQSETLVADLCGQGFKADEVRDLLASLFHFGVVSDAGAQAVTPPERARARIGQLRHWSQHTSWPQSVAGRLRSSVVVVCDELGIGDSLVEEVEKASAGLVSLHWGGGTQGTGLEHFTLECIRTTGTSCGRRNRNGAALFSGSSTRALAPPEPLNRPIDLVVAVVRELGHLAGLNLQCFRANIPLLGLCIDNLRVIVGPLVVPGESACIQCMLDQRGLVSGLSRPRQSGGLRRPTQVLRRAPLRRAVAVAARLLIDALSGCHEIHLLAGTATEFDARAGTQHRVSVWRMPGCSVCSRRNKVPTGSVCSGNGGRCVRAND